MSWTIPGSKHRGGPWRRVVLYSCLVVTGALLRAPCRAQQTEPAVIADVLPPRALTNASIQLLLQGISAQYLVDHEPTVYFDSVRAKVTGVADTTIEVTVPSGTSPWPKIRVAVGSERISSDVFRVIPRIQSVDPVTARAGSRVTLTPDVLLPGEEDIRVWMFSKELEIIDSGSLSILVALPDSVNSPSPELSLEIDGVRGEAFRGLKIETGSASSREPSEWFALVFGMLGLLVLLAWAVQAIRRRLGAARKRGLAKATSTDVRRPPTGELLSPPYEGPAIAEVPEELAEALAAGSCVLFGGGGISAAAGFPTWEHGLDQLRRRAIAALGLRGKEESSAGDPREDASIRSLHHASPDEALDLVLAHLGFEFVFSFIEEAYGRRVKRLPKLASTLSAMPFTGVVTTNWDEVLPRCFRGRGRPRLATEWEELTGVFRESEFFLVKLYGDLEQRDSVVLTPADYSLLLEKNGPFRRFLMSLYASKTFLFLGASRRSLEIFLSELAHEPTERTHYALLPYERGFDSLSTVFENKYRVQLLGYRPTSAEHLEVVEFVDRLKTRVSELEASQPDSGDGRTPWLQRIQLENIGPFERLDLELEPSWNVLLGDNGCGKSTILRAVALGLCGPDERVGKLAGNLLRHKASRGSVALTIRDETYTTELTREHGRVRITSPQRYTPLESGEWLALGFPALRGVSDRDPTQPSPEIEKRPAAADDLLPLLGGEVDRRMNDIKQWIFNAHTRSSADDGEELKRIFSLLESVTPGLQLSFSRVDSESMKILVNTDDGEVPLEILSQGTASVIGVVGTLLQRLSAVYGDRPEQAPRPALVVVDELAAHMHPSWQYSLAGLVQRTFRDLQIIAATHSPLLLGSIEEGTIFRLERRDEGGISVKPSQRPLYGWLAEDIYEFMGLEDTRAEGFRTRLNTFKQLDAMRIQGTASEEQLDQLARLRKGLEALPGEDPVSLTMELDNLADLLDEDAPAIAPGGDS